MRSAGTPAWTLIIVPPSATASKRRVGLKMRWFVMLALLMSTVATLTWAWVSAEQRVAEMIADRLAAEQQTTLALRDTLQLLRSASVAERVRNSPPVDMMMPVTAEITSRFTRSRFHPILQIFRAHRGVDFGAASGTRIVAPAAGTVVSSGWRIGYGLTIEVAHTGGVVTRYAHCRSSMVKRGDHVAMGQAIATVGSSGLATAPHLHFELLVRGKQVDPVKFLASTHTAPVSMPAAVNK